MGAFTPPSGRGYYGLPYHQRGKIGAIIPPSGQAHRGTHTIRTGILGGYLIHHPGGYMGVFTAPSAVDKGSVYSTIREVIWGCSNDNQDGYTGGISPIRAGMFEAYIHIITMAGISRVFTPSGRDNEGIHTLLGGAVRAHLPHHQGGSMQGAFTPPSGQGCVGVHTTQHAAYLLTVFHHFSLWELRPGRLVPPPLDCPV